MDTAIKELCDDTTNYVNEAKDLWKELEDEVENGEKSFYQKFDFKETPGYLETIVEKVKEVKVHLSATVEVLVADLSQGRHVSGPNAAINTVARVVQGVQTLVRDHGVALEFMRELFNQQEEKITEVKELVQGPGVHNHEWMVNEVKKQVEEQVKVVTTKLDSMEEQLEVVKGDNLLLKKENKELKEEVDETRQRGMKGNIIIKAFPGRDGVDRFKALSRPGGGRLENQVEVCSRLVQGTSGFQVPSQEVAACHKMPNSEHTWVISLKRVPGGVWEALSAAMLCGKRQDGDYFADTGVYLAFQLTKQRSKVLHQVRLARKEKLLERFSVNMNGRITILRTKPPRTQPGQPREKEVWEVVKDVEGLQRLFPQSSFPLIDPRQEENARRARVAQPNRR